MLDKVTIRLFDVALECLSEAKNATKKQDIINQLKFCRSYLNAADINTVEAELDQLIEDLRNHRGRVSAELKARVKAIKF